MLRAVAEPTRLRLLAICASGEMTVSEITQVIGQSQPRVSRHLKLLCDAGLLRRFREQSWVYYRVPSSGEGAEMSRWVLARLDPTDPGLQADRRRIAEVTAARAALASNVLNRIGADLDELAAIEAEIDAAIRHELPEGDLGDLLDIGTGTGRMLKLLGERARKAIGVDISSEMRLVARTQLYDAGLGHCTVQHGDMHELPFTDRSFDLVTMDQVLHLGDRPQAVLDETARILRPGGRVLIVEQVGGQGDYSERQDKLRNWLATSGLVGIRVRQLPYKNPLAALTLASRASLREDAA